MTDTIAKYRAQEWASTKETARKKWVKTVLGERPNFKSIRKTITNPFEITLLEWLAMGVLLVLTVFTTFKVGAVAVPFSNSLLAELSKYQAIHPVFMEGFTIVTVTLFAMLATPSLVYFQLLNNDREIERQKTNTSAQAARSKKYLGFIKPYVFSLEYITPRIPAFIVYISTGWLFYVSSAGDGTVFEKYLPVITEVGLAHLVGVIIEKRSRFNGVVRTSLENATNTYNTRLENYETDPTYLKLLYQQMREDIIKIKRNGRYPNLWVENTQQIDDILLSEYRRMNGGVSFANKALATDEVPEVATHSVGISVEMDSKRVPPTGYSIWTPELLYEDLRIRGIGSDYTEKQLQKDYAAGYEARTAWRKGVKQMLAAEA